MLSQDPTKTILRPSCYYHIYNRGNHRRNIFFEQKNYHHFLTKWATYIEPIAETYSFCLLPNHYHILVRIRELDTIIANLDENFPIHRIEKIRKNPERYIHNQFGHVFNAYVQHINHKRGGNGTLFQGHFQRLWIDNELYYRNVVHYIHQNPQKHKIVADFRIYPYSSYAYHLSTKPTLLMRDAVLSMFGGANLYEEYHQQVVDEKSIKDYLFPEDEENTL